MPITKDDEQGKLRLGQGLRRASLPQTPSVVPHIDPAVPHIRPAAMAATLATPPGPPPPQAPRPVRPLPVTPQPRVSPAGFATDLTPRGKKADLVGRGAAMLMRGNLASQLVKKNFRDTLGPGEQHALATLHSPEDLYNPKNQDSLNAIIRPGPVLGQAIQSNPVLQHNREVILQRLRDVGHGVVKGSDQEQYANALANLSPQEHQYLDTLAPAERRAWVESTYKTGNANPLLHREAAVRTTEPPTSGTGALAAAMAHGTDYSGMGPPQEQLPQNAASFGTGVPTMTQNFITGGAKTAIGLGPGLVKLGEQQYQDTQPGNFHPWTPLANVGEAIGKDYAEKIQHPARAMQNDPFGMFMDTVGMGAGSAGALARVTGVARDLRGVGAAAEAEHAVGPIEQAGVDAHKINELRSMARDRGLPVSGNKAALHARLVEHERSAADFERWQGHQLTTDGHPMVNPTPEELANNPWMAKHVVSTSPSGHQIHFGGNEHDDLWNAMQKKGILSRDMKFTDTGEPQIAATLIHDLETGKPVSANIGKIDGTGMTKAQVKALERKILKRAQASFADKGELPQTAGLGSRVGAAARTLVWGPRAGAQVIEHNGVRVVVPYSKSALGRVVQNSRMSGVHLGGRTLFPGLLDRLDHPSTLLNDTLDKVYKNAVPLRRLSNIRSPEGQFGRLLGKQGRLQEDQAAAMGAYRLGHAAGPSIPATVYNKLFNRGEDVSALRSKPSLVNRAVTRATGGDPSLLRSPREGRMTHEQQIAASPDAQHIIGTGRAIYTHDKHQELWAMGKPTKEGLRDPVAINIPKPGVKIKPKEWATESQAAQKFERLITQGAEKTGKSNPNAVKYVERGMLNGVRRFDPSKVGNGMQALDWAQSVIRSGRFLHPGYLGWALQNGILHTSQAGMFALRNAWQLHNHWAQFPDEARAAIDGDMGQGMARATAGEHEVPGLRTFINKAGAFWHTIDDSPWRRMSWLHEANREGFHTVEDQIRLATDPKLKDLRQAIAQRGRNEAIDYNAMTPAERHYLKAAFTAWGWTRGASAWAKRFPIEHPIQGQFANAIGHQGSQMVDQYYHQHGGMPPAWLESAAAVTGGASPWLMGTSLFNPAETPGRIAGEIPGMRQGSIENLASEVSPPVQGILEGFTQKDRFGNQFRGWDRATRPFTDMLKRFEPISVASTLGKKSGSTVGGPQGAAVKYLGLPLIHLADVDKTAALGQKDFESALSRGDLIKFRAQDHIDRIPQEAAAFQKMHGVALDPGVIGRYKGALDTIEHIQQFQQQYASQKGHNSYRSLPAANKVESALQYMQTVGTPADEVARFRDMAQRMTDDTQLEHLAAAMWMMAGHGATHMASHWKSNIVDASKPKKLTKAQ